jgi:hypothetical protein
MLDYLFTTLQHAVVFGQVMRDSGYQYTPLKEFNDYSKSMRDAARARMESQRGR